MSTKLPMHVLTLNSPADEAADLIASQVNFGLAYVKEARCAYESGNLEYAEVARKIALNAYAAAIRFSARMAHAPAPDLAHRVEDLEHELDTIMNPAVEMSLRSIA